MPVYPPPSAGGAASNTIILQDEGSVIGTATTLNFVGAGVTATYLANVGTATISGGGGSAPASAKYKRSSGNYTTTSTTFADVDTTNMSLTITTAASRVLVGFVGSCSNSAADTLFFDVTVDGTRQGGDFGIAGENEASNAYRNYSFVYLTDTLTAASHTFKLQWRNVNGTTSTMWGAATSATNPVFWVAEVA